MKGLIKMAKTETFEELIQAVIDTHKDAEEDLLHTIFHELASSFFAYKPDEAREYIQSALSVFRKNGIIITDQDWQKEILPLIIDTAEIGVIKMISQEEFVTKKEIWRGAIMQILANYSDPECDEMMDLETLTKITNLNEFLGLEKIKRNNTELMEVIVRFLEKDNDKEIEEITPELQEIFLFLGWGLPEFIQELERQNNQNFDSKRLCLFYLGMALAKKQSAQQILQELKELKSKFLTWKKLQESALAKAKDLTYDLSEAEDFVYLLQIYRLFSPRELNSNLIQETAQGFLDEAYTLENSQELLMQAGFSLDELAHGLVREAEPTDEDLLQVKKEEFTCQEVDANIQEYLRAKLDQGRGIRKIVANVEAHLHSCPRCQTKHKVKPDFVAQQK